jgi:hypothetical protein
MATEWQEETEEGLRELEDLVAEAGRRVESSDEATRQEWQETVRATNERIDWIREDGSKGVHNPFLAGEIVDSATREIRAYLEKH